MTQFLYLTVAEWGGRWARKPVAEKLLDSECAVHHVGGSAWMGGAVGTGEAASRRAAIKVFFDLNEYAIRVKGYSFLDYDILVWHDRFNNICWIAEGRGKWLSAATLDRNEIAEAIVLCGNTHVREPLAAELEGLARGIVLGIQKGWMSKDTFIYPHRDNPAHPGATQCCGQFLIPKLKPIVIPRVAELLDPPAPPPPPPTPPVQEFDTMIPAVGKCTDGAYLAQFEFRGPVYLIGTTAAHDVKSAEVFGRGGGRAFDVVEQKIVTEFTWPAVDEELTQAQLRARLTG